MLIVLCGKRNFKRRREQSLSAFSCLVGVFWKKRRLCEGLVSVYFFFSFFSSPLTPFTKPLPMPLAIPKPFLTPFPTASPAFSAVSSIFSFFFSLPNILTSARACLL
jgi:hypothetical protein